MIQSLRDRRVSLRLRGFARLVGLSCALLLAGCHAWQPAVYEPPEIGFVPPPSQNNPALVSAANPDLVWDQVVDVVDDYFQIEHEQRVRLAGDVLTEGRLDTYPRSGSTLFEPWNADSANLYERWESTLQSIRRRATVRVIPAVSGGYLVDVQVIKELEDVPRPETGAVSLANASTLRNDNSLQRVTNPVAGLQPNAGWIELGRDPALEQDILAHIQARLGSPTPVVAYATARAPGSEGAATSVPPAAARR